MIYANYIGLVCISNTGIVIEKNPTSEKLSILQFKVVVQLS